MIDLDHAALDHFVGDFMTTATIGLNKSLVRFFGLEEMTRKTHVGIDAEVLVPLEMTVAEAACNLYTVNRF